MQDMRKQKIQMWLKNLPEMKFPTPLNLPSFAPKSFRNYAEMNTWKQEYLKEIAKQGSIKWKFS